MAGEAIDGGEGLKKFLAVPAEAGVHHEGATSISRFIRQRGQAAAELYLRRANIESKNPTQIILSGNEKVNCVASGRC